MNYYNIHPTHKKANELLDAINKAGKDYADGIFKACEEGRKNDKNTTWLDGQANILLKQMTDTIEPLQKEYDKLFV